MIVMQVGSNEILTV